MCSPEEIKARIEALEEIPTLPHVMAEIIRVTEDRSSTAKDLAEVIATDQSLSASLLRMVNSAYYALRREITSVDECVVMLGYNTVKQVATAISVFNSVGVPKGGLEFNRQILWTHSLATATIANYFELELRSSHSEVHGAYLAGLLHDIGKALFHQLYPDKMTEIMRKTTGEGIPFRAAENAILETTHCEIGAWAAKAWKFPEWLQNSILHHEEPDMCPEPRIITEITHLADIVAHNGGFPSPGNATKGEMPVIPMDDINWDEGKQEAIQVILVRNKKFFEALGLELS